CVRDSEEGPQPHPCRADRVPQGQGNRQVQAARASRNPAGFPGIDLRQGVEKGAGGDGGGETGTGAGMRIIDLHCYPGTKEWIACQGPYVDALAKYWKRDWVGKSEDQVIGEFTDAGVEACL